MSIDNADLVRRLKEAKKNYSLGLELGEDAYTDEASELLSSVIKDLETMVDDGR